MNIGEKLKKLRETNCMTRKESADKLKELGIDISDKTLYGYESGRNSPNADMFLALCQIYKCNNVMETFSDSVDDILFTNEEWGIVEKYRFISDHSPEGKETVDYILNREFKIAQTLQENNAATVSDTAAPIRLINYYYRLASAGTGQILFDTPPTKRIEIPNIKEYQHVDYAIGVNGKSMEPTYKDGDTLLIEVTEEINVGEIGIFLVDGECYVKKLGEKELISLNPAYRNVPLNETARCMGRVIRKL